MKWAKTQEDRGPRRRFNKGENGEAEPQQQKKEKKGKSQPKEKKQEVEFDENGDPVKKVVEEDKPRLAQFQKEAPKETKKVVEEKPKGYIAPTLRQAPPPVVHRFKVHIQSETSNASTTVLIDEEEYLKYILPLVSRHLK